MSTFSTANESELRRLIGELEALGPKHGVARLLAVKPRCLCCNAQAFTVVVKALCAQGNVWLAEFRKRATRKKKCAPEVRTLLEECLQPSQYACSPDPVLTPSDIVRRSRHPKSAGTLVVHDQYELGFGPEHRQYVAKLHDLQRQPLPIDLTVEFNCDLVYVHGLAMLAAWCDRYAARVNVTCDNPWVSDYLDATGFRRVVEDQTPINELFWDGKNHVALTRIDREDQESANEIAERLVGLFVKHRQLDRSQESAMTVMFAELVENVYRHAKSRYPSYVMAQAYPSARKFHVGIADTGIGIFASFRESDVKEVRGRATSEANTLDMAFKKLVTSKAHRHQGYGLFVVRRLVERNFGEMRLMSGRSTKRIAVRSRGPLRSPQRTEKHETHLPWRGTEVSIMFDLDQPFPLLEVWKELGSHRNPEDFFS